MLGELGLSIGALVQSWLTPTSLFLLLNLVIGTILVTSKGFRSRQREDHHDGTPKLARASSALECLRSIGFYRYGSGEIPHDTTHAHHPEGFDGPHDEPPKIARAPSSVFEHLRSIGLYRYHSGEVPLDTTPGRQGVDVPQDEQPKLVRAPSVLERLRSIGLYRFRSGEIPPEANPSPAPGSEVSDVHAQSQTHDQHFGRSQSESRSKEGRANLARRTTKSASAKSTLGHFEEAEIVQGRSTAQAVRHEEEEKEVDARADDFINRFRQQLRLQRLDSIMQYKEMLNRGR